MYDINKILDFSSERGILEDRTGRNMLTLSNVEIKRMGNIYCAYFNGSASITCDKPIISNTDFMLSTWLIKPKTGTIGNKGIITNNAFMWLSNNNGNVYYVSNDGLITYNSFDTDINKITHYLFIRFSNQISIYKNGIFNANIMVGNPYISTTNLVIGENNMVFILKLQIFQGISSNFDQFATQIYNNQKGMFGL